MMEFERTFDRAANDYDLVRPFYPVELYRDLFRYKPLNAQSHVLEIGADYYAKDAMECVRCAEEIERG